jgi:hypothetical protein
MKYTLTFEAPAATVESADSETRRLAGVAIPYGEEGVTSAGVLTIDAGAVRVPANLKACKLFREHGRMDAVGYAVEATDAKDALRMAFNIARTPDGDRALLEASEGLRDALSVELNNVEVKAGHVIGADLVAVAQVAVPAFANAVLTAALDDQAQADAHQLAVDLADALAPEETEETPPAESEATMTQTEASAAPAALNMAPTTPRRDPGNDRHVWAAAASEIVKGTSNAVTITAALNDITPTTATTGEAFPRPVWLDQLWTPAAVGRRLVNAIGVSPLTGMVMEGWKWETSPVVSPYAGEKNPVPSSPAKIKPASATAQRIAGGWDLDRIYVDFPTGFLTAFQTAAIKDYVKKSSTYLIDGHATITGPPAIPAVTGIAADAYDLGTQPDAMTAIAACVAYLSNSGANVSFIAMASNVFGAYLKLTGAQAPWWLANQGSVGLNGQTTVAGTDVFVDPALPAGQILAGDKDAVSLWETGPIQVEAVNLPQGGIDWGLIGYYAHLVHDDDGLCKANVTVVMADESSTQASKKK